MSDESRHEPDSGWEPVPPGTVFQVWEDADPCGEGGVTTIRALDARGWLDRGLLGRRPRLVLDFAADSWEAAARVHDEIAAGRAPEGATVERIVTEGRERARHPADGGRAEVEAMLDRPIGGLIPPASDAAPPQFGPGAGIDLTGGEPSEAVVRRDREGEG